MVRSERSRLPLVLIVEDHAGIRDICATILKNEGFRVAIAKDGREAHDRALRLRPNLIVMDLALPVIDGASVTRILKQKDETSRIPVIAISAYDSEDSRNRAISAGCDSFLSKPFEIDDLLREIHRVMGAREDQIPD